VIRSLVLALGRAGHCRSGWGGLSLVSTFYGNSGTKFPAERQSRRSSECNEGDFRKGLTRAREDKPKSARGDFRYDLTRVRVGGFPKGLRACARDVPGTFSKTLRAGVA
jgi:hypothetical protein